MKKKILDKVAENEKLQSKKENEGISLFMVVIKEINFLGN